MWVTLEEQHLRLTSGFYKYGQAHLYAHEHTYTQKREGRTEGVGGEGREREVRGEERRKEEEKKEEQGKEGRRKEEMNK